MPFQSHRWQTIATLDEPAFESFIAEKKAQEDALTSTGLYRFARELLKPPKTETPPFPAQKYRVLYADPPWSYRNDYQASVVTHFEIY